MAIIEFSANPSCPPKRPRSPPPLGRDETRNPVDRISELPDAIILHVFSFLETRDAMRTSVLSKRWRSAWTANPHISFSMPSDYDGITLESFIAFMDAVLLRCTANKVKSFLFKVPCLTFYSTSDSAVGPTIDRWLQFAVKHGLEELTMRKDNIYALPQFFFRCTTLVSLHVSRCCFPMIGAVNWCSLKRLRIEDTAFDDDTMMRILRGSPVLEFLQLEYCVGFNRIIVESRCLTELVIDCDQVPILKISAPHLLKLRLLGDYSASERVEFRVDEVSSLVEAEVNFKTQVHKNDKLDCVDVVKGLLERLQHVTTLVVGSWCLQYLHPEFFARNVGHRDFDAEEMWNSTKRRICQCPMHLKIVEIVDPGANWLVWEPVLSLLKFLLQNARWLDKIEINSNNSRLSGGVDPWGLLEVARIILSDPNRSPSLKVILSYPSRGCPSERVHLQES